MQAVCLSPLLWPCPPECPGGEALTLPLSERKGGFPKHIPCVQGVGTDGGRVARESAEKVLDGKGGRLGQEPVAVPLHTGKVSMR